VPGAGDRGGAALAAQGEPIAVDEPSTPPVGTITTVAGEHPDSALGAGAHPPRMSKRRATADEAKNLRPKRPRRGRRSRRQGK